MDDEWPPRCVTETHEVYDRFTFDALFLRLLADGYDHEEAKDIIMHHCALSALTLQERIHNKHYFRLSRDALIARDMLQLRHRIETTYGHLEQEVGVPIKPAPDEWDRLYNVDFFIEVNGKYIGIQIKPVTFEHTFEEYKWKNMQETSHAKFEQKFGGKVFTVFSAKVGGKKVILNREVIEQIKQEIRRLRGESNQ
jgi:hypothetical protein